MSYRILLTILCFFSLFSHIQAQDKNTQLWRDVRDNSFTPKGTRYIIPNKYRTLALDLAGLRQYLAAAPMEIIGQDVPNALLLSLPMPDGSFHKYRIVESPIMHPDLAAQFPEIKTYAGQGVTDPTATIRLDITLEGFHAMVLSGQGSIFIDPYALFDTEYYISYYKRDYTARGKSFFELDPIDNRSEADRNLLRDIQNPNGSDGAEAQQLQSTDGKHRHYRLALAGTGEYTAFHGGTVAGGMSGMTTSMNRVNGVYERELSVRMTMVANNNSLVYTNSGSDPYTNNDGGTMLSQNQSTCNSVIGSANYDIGHVFSTGGGGVAQLGCVCTSSKAQGVTGSGSPVGDPFDIDYVAHEMGHQFGCEHSFNDGSNGACGGNRNNSTAYEIGSGSTIMSYAGICSPSNVQNNSDDYFNGGALDEALAFIVTQSGNSCPTKTTITHTAPTVNAGNNYTIPKSTPFTLTGSATDDDAGLTYCWEEMDLGAAASLSTPLSGNMPAFRSYDPVTSPSRTFPIIQTVIANTTSNVEKLPNYARTMNFRLTVRDNHTGSGRIGVDNMTVTIDANSGPFLVTAPNATGISVSAQSSYTVTWDVASTTAAPVSCANVNILLSTDGGLTYPITVLANTPNDGTQSVTIPNNPTTTARIRVQCANNVFFDISNNNFTITTPTNPDFSMTTNPGSQSVCAPANAVYTINTTQIAGLTTPINFTVAGLPAGAVGTFAPTSAVPGNSATLTISNTALAAAGTYNVTVTGTAGTLTHTAAIVLSIFSGTPAIPSIQTPGNAALGVGVTPTFTWSAATNAATYDVQIATDAAFTNIVATSSATGIVGTTYTPTTALSGGSTYFWRVRGVNGCAVGAYSLPFIFATAGNACITFNSTDVPRTISSSGTPTVTSTVTVSGSGTITDVNLLTLTGTHTWISDLSFSLRSPANTTRNLMTNVCDDENNFALSFDDESTNTYASIPCPPVGGGTYQPVQTLSNFDGQNGNGVWTLTVADGENQDGGSLTAWAVQVCTAATGAINAPSITANLTAFLEGAFSSGTMTTALRTSSLVPAVQPYTVAPFNYNGAESAANVAALPANMTDWVLVEIYNTSFSLVERRSGIINSAGAIREPDGTALKFYLLQNNASYYVVIRHRNHLAVMSAAPIVITASTLTYDFTTAVTQANGASQMVGSSGKTLLRAGDMDVNGVINYSDYNVYKNATTGYVRGDANLSGTISTTDFDLYRSNASSIGIPLLRY